MAPSTPEAPAVGVPVGTAIEASALALVAAGGAIGSLLRWTISALLAGTGGGFPWPTYLVNVVGSLCLGVLSGRLWHSPNEPLRLFAGVGLLGGFTTFSTYAVEVIRHGSQGQVTVALVYAIGSVASSGIAAALGVVLAHSATPRKPLDE